jgi:Family of unknown function (DUF6932)
MSLEFSEYGYLVPVEDAYPMTLAQIKTTFGSKNHARRNIFDGLNRGVKNLVKFGVERIVLGGSFVSHKEHPSDADIAWWYNPDINWNQLDPVFQSENRKAAIGKYLLDQKVDGIEDVPYSQSHEYLLRTNHRVPPEFQRVGIVKIVTEVTFDYV